MATPQNIYASGGDSSRGAGTEGASLLWAANGNLGLSCERGATLFRVLRFDPSGERTRFLTLSLWRDAAGLRWRWMVFPTPRPLYNLDKLAARSDAPVVICEGEKSADAAARVIPDSVCVTSPNGSQSASKADWSPLHGRRVLIWPDANEQGSTYAAEVAAILHPLDCRFRSSMLRHWLPSIQMATCVRYQASGLCHIIGNLMRETSRRSRGDGFVPCLHLRGPKGLGALSLIGGGVGR